MTDYEHRLSEVRKADRRATMQLIGFFVLLFGTAALCVYGWMAMLSILL
jgi:hypothetical protein